VRPFGAKPWFLVGGGGAIAIVGAILLPIGITNVNNAAATCPTRVNCAQSVADQGNSGRTETGVGAGLLAGGVALAAGGLIWQLAANKPSAAAPSAPPQTGARSLWVTPTGARGIAAGGSF
jgi:hypothetical protein